MKTKTRYFVRDDWAAALLKSLGDGTLDTRLEKATRVWQETLLEAQQLLNAAPMTDVIRDALVQIHKLKGDFYLKVVETGRLELVPVPVKAEPKAPKKKMFKTGDALTKPEVVVQAPVVEPPKPVEVPAPPVLMPETVEESPLDFDALIGDSFEDPTDSH